MTFISQLNWRYATKKFDGKIVPEEDLATIKDAIRLAPTSYGLQPFHVTIVESAALKASLKEKAWNQEQLTSCSHLFIFSANSEVMARIDAYLNIVSGGDSTARANLKGYEDMMKGSLGTRPVEGLQAWSAKQAYIALGFALAAAAELGIDSCPMEGFDPVAFKEILALPANLSPVVLLPIGYRSPEESPRPKTRFPEAELFDVK